ncbi:MAG: DUF3794 domain-containing protein [Lachnospiraceae bacterium]|nr:DUF3794 domain-containing protein [Lachnospiraceae bacterium]
MELERKYAALNSRRGSALSQMTLEQDINVPDQKPDIFRIVHKQGEFRPDEMKGESGKMKVRGIFLYRILYIGESADRMPEILEGSIPVDEVIFLNGLEEGDILDVRWEIEHLHASMIHSRKANIKGILAFTADAMKEQPVPLVFCPEEDKEMYVKTCPVHIQQEVIHKKDTLRVREEINLPPGRPNIQRILWKEIRLQGTDVRQEDRKLLVKGELVVFFLYLCEEGRMQWMEQGIPFHQEVECDVCHADLTGKAEVSLLRSELELQADYDGEPRTVRLDAVLELLFRYFEDSVCEVLCDAYSLSCELEPVRKEYHWDFVKGISDSRARVGGRMKLSDTEPKMMQILNAGTRLHLDHAERNEKGILTQGNVELWVLYATSDDAQPLACTVQFFPFEHIAEMQLSGDDCDWQIHLCLDQLMVNMLDAQELEIKSVIQMQVLFSQPESEMLIEDLNEAPLDKERIKQMPGMVIHVVQPGETLWDISKAHAATCRAVMELNEMKDETLKPGQKLLIVKEVMRT